ncbi:MAG: hypothetical protein ACE5IG_03540 [Dehalococcoidia bacterium]
MHELDVVQGDVENPSVAFFDQGTRFVVAWDHERENEHAGAVRARIFTSDGVPMGEAFRVSREGPFLDCLVTLFRERRAEEIHITGPGPTPEEEALIQSQCEEREVGSGRRWGGSFESEARPYSDGFVVVWADAQNGKAPDVYASLFTEEGQPQAEDFRVDKDYPWSFQGSGGEACPALSPEQEGEESSEQRLERIQAEGTQVYLPTVAFDGDGNGLVLWKDGALLVPSDGGMEERPENSFTINGRFFKDGVPVEEEFRLDHTVPACHPHQRVDAFIPSVLNLAPQEWAVIYPVIEYEYFGEKDLFSLEGEQAEPLFLRMGEDFLFHVAGPGEEAGQGSIMGQLHNTLWARKVIPDGLSQPVQVNEGDTLLELAVGRSTKERYYGAVNEEGIILIAWTDVRRGEKDVYARALDPDLRPLTDEFLVAEGAESPNLAVVDQEFVIVWRATEDGQIAGRLVSVGEVPITTAVPDLSAVLQSSPWEEEERPKPQVQETVVQEGDLVLSEDRVFELSDVRFILRGNLVVRDRATFRAINVILEVPQEYNRQHGIKVQNNATFELQNVFIDSGGPWLNIDFMDRSQVTLKSVWSPDPNIPWYTAQENTQVLIEDSVVGMTPYEGATARMTIRRSNVWIELLIPSEGRVNASFPSGFTEAWGFPSSGDSGISYAIQAEQTIFRQWSMGLAPGARVTVRDTDPINFLFGVGWTWSGAVAELRDLRPGYVADRTWEADGAVLRLVNTYVGEWYPNAGGNGELTIVDSELGEMEPWGEAKVIIRNSRVEVIHASEQVQVWVYDSVIDHDVITFDQAVVHLFNTEVRGEIRAVDNGRVYVDGELQ